MRASILRIVFPPRAYLLFETASECAGKAMLRGVGGPWRRHGPMKAPTRQTWCSKRTIQGVRPERLRDGPGAGLTTCVAVDGHAAPRSISEEGAPGRPQEILSSQNVRADSACMHGAGGRLRVIFHFSTLYFILIVWHWEAWSGSESEAMARSAAPGPSREFQSEGGTVDFGWSDDKKVSGRRKKLQSQQKAKPGSFGTGRYVAGEVGVLLRVGCRRLWLVL